MWVANECLSTCGLTGRSTPAARAAARTAFWTPLGPRWWSLGSPDRGSTDGRRAQNTYRHPHSVDAPRVLGPERPGQAHGRRPARDLLLVPGPLGGQVERQRLGDGRGEHGHPVPPALPLADREPPPVGVEVVDPEPEPLAEPQPGAVEDHPDEPVDAPELAQDGVDLGPREDDREPLRPPGPGDPVDAAERAAEDVVVQEQDGVERLVLGRCGDPSVLGEVGEERGEVGLGERVGVAGPAVVVRVEEAVPSDPVGVGLFRVVRVVAPAELGPEPVEEPGAAGGRGGPGWVGGGAMRTGSGFVRGHGRGGRGRKPLWEAELGPRAAGVGLAYYTAGRACTTRPPST